MFKPTIQNDKLAFVVIVGTVAVREIQNKLMEQRAQSCHQRPESEIPFDAVFYADFSGWIILGFRFYQTTSLHQSCMVDLERQIAPAATTVTTVNTDATEEKAKAQEDEDSVDVNGFWRGIKAVGHHLYDEKLSIALVKFLKNESVTSIIDLGAGMGLYSKHFMSQNIFTSCYDGNPNTVEISEGRCATVDLSNNINFYRHEWVMSLEVGEHIPAKFEDIFIGNLERVNKNGMILSWAIEGQGGRSHVNNRNNSYIKNKISKLGYTADETMEKALRAAAVFGWFKNTIMVFRRNTESTFSMY